jgi:hypothetical protein
MFQSGTANFISVAFSSVESVNQMCAFVPGRSPAGVVRAAIVPLLFSAAVLAEGGCASNNSSTYYASAPAVAAYSRQAAAEVQIEDDGLPSQAPPLARIHQMPDDPSEPYSRNYGGFNPASVEYHPAVEHKSADASAGWATSSQRTVPADLPPTFRRQLAQAGYVVD